MIPSLEKITALFHKKKKEGIIAKLGSTLGQNSYLIVFYGFVLVCSMALQCLAQFAELLSAHNERFAIIALILNKNFSVPVPVLAWLWTSICALYIGADRVAFAVHSTKTGKNNLDIGHPERLRLIVWESFIVYVIGILLNLFFDVNLELESLAGAFGSAILLYATGNKAIKMCSALAPEDDLDGDGVADTDQDPKEVLERLKVSLKSSNSPFDENDMDGDGIVDSEQDPKEVLERVRKVLLSKNEKSNHTP
jgi:hypothetical protein